MTPVASFAGTLQGVITANRVPLAGASVSIEARATVKTAEDGRFALELPDGKYTLRVSHEGFQPETVEVTTGQPVTVAMRPLLAESIVVSGIRADADTPVVRSDLTRADIRRTYYGQDIPMLLRQAPSINAYAEGGVGGAGYSYITLRGISPTRLNFTFDGVPLSDSEDMATYFVDLPDLAHSLESIQMQRGVGTSTVGSPSFGGSVNFESIAPSSTRNTEAWLGGGSFGTKLASVAHQTGDLPGGFLAYGRVSIQQTDGFREHSGVRQHSVFVSAAKQNQDSQIKFTGFAGHEYQQESFLAADEATLATNLRFNPLSPNDRDSFGYNLGQLQYMRENMTASVYFQRGYGWYRLDDVQYGLDGLLLGSMLTYTATAGRLTANYGLNVNHFKREHTRFDYSNYGTKGDANGFAKFSYDLDRLRLYTDLQVRTADFHYHGNVAIDPIRWTFFNPKAGARYELSPRSSVYGSIGVATREPARNDLFQGEDNATVRHDLHAVLPERLVDVEAGYELRGNGVTLAANVYSMQFRHEIAATGELSDIGLPLRRNVDRSYRRGFELEGTWQATDLVRFRGSASVSRNRIHIWIQSFGDKPVVYRNVNPLLTPSVILNQSIEYTPTPRLILSGTGRYVAKSYLDNTNNDAFTTPSFFVLDGTVAFDLSHSARVTLQMNNILNKRRVFPSGYSDLVSGVRYYYPQATRNIVMMLDVHL